MYIYPQLSDKSYSAVDKHASHCAHSNSMSAYKAIKCFRIALWRGSGY